jgi:exodeoxyribonuclease VII small subunit
MNEAGFEEKMDRLDEIIRSIAGGGARLAESVALFEEGMKLVGEMENELSQVKQKVATLMSSAVEGGEA